MNELMTFEFDTKQIRIVDKDGEPWFVGKDVAEALGYTNSSSAVASHVAFTDKRPYALDTNGGKQLVTVINEHGLYSMAFSSHMENAKNFQSWVMEEVIPAIRNKGAKQMNEIMNFEFHGNTVRTTMEDGQVWFCGKDICNQLEYTNSRKALDDHCRGVTNRYPIVDALGRKQEAVFISEPDVWRLICSSKQPVAVELEKWIFEEVLPTIKKHGGYLTPSKIEEVLLNPDTIIRLATELKEERAKRVQLEEQRKKDHPKVLFADSVCAAKTSILVGDLAKLLKQNGVDTGGTRLFQQLRTEGYLMNRQGTSWNMPTQYSMDLGLMEVKESTHTNPDGSIVVTRTPKVTGKGQLYFINKYCSRAVIAE